MDSIIAEVIGGSYDLRLKLTRSDTEMSNRTISHLKELSKQNLTWNGRERIFDYLQVEVVRKNLKVTSLIDKNKVIQAR